MKRRAVIIVFVSLLLGVVLLVYYAQDKAKNGKMYYSGTIEATQSNLAFQVAGRVGTVMKDEGQTVKAGEILAELDTSELKARYDQAESGLNRAMKTTEQLQAQLDIYRTTLPEDVKRARAGESAARNTYDDAQRNFERYQDLYSKGVVAEKDHDAVRLNFENAGARLEEARAVLNQSMVNLRKMTVVEKDIEASQAQEKLLQAALEQARIQLGYARLVCPINGIVTSRSVELGEVVSPGREVFTVADLAQVDLKIYVEETAIGRVKPGQKVNVMTDTFPDRTFPGIVSYISPEAEFTPKIIQTKKERVKLVYLVKVTIDNPKTELKAGMPADAYLE